MYSFGSTTSKPAPRWAKSIGRAFFGSLFGLGDAQPVSKVRDSESLTGSDSADTSQDKWKVLYERKSVYLDLDRMDSSDEIVSTALDITADCAVGHEGVKVTTKDARVEQVLNDLFRRLNMNDLAWQIARNCAKHGHPFYEVVLDRSEGCIIRLKETIFYRISPCTNSRNDKLPGWLYSEESATTGMGTTAQELEEWQIIEFPFGRRTGLYAFPALATARKNWNRLGMIEDGMAIARLTRAYDKLVHRIPIEKNWTPEQVGNALNRYKTAITKKSFTGDSNQQRYEQNPFQVQTDFYLPDDGSQRGGIETLSSVNNQLLRLDDVYYLRERILSRLMVPIQYLQIMSTQKTHLTAGGSLTDAEKQFNRMLLRLQMAVRYGLQRLCDLELSLQGITPTPGLYTLEFPKVTSDDQKMEAEIDLINAQAATYFVEAFGFLPTELLGRLFLRLSPEEQVLFEAYAKKDAEEIRKNQFKKMETDAAPKPTPAVAKNQHREMFAKMQTLLMQTIEEAGEDAQDIRAAVEQSLVDFTIAMERGESL